MQTMARSEQRLFLILCGTVFLGLNMIGVRAFFQNHKKMRVAIAAARMELAGDRSWLELADTLRPINTWIKSHPMPSMLPDEASAKLLKIERDEAEKEGLKVTGENLLPSQEGPEGMTVGVAAKISGPFEGVVRMLFALQSPVGWRSIDKMILTSDVEPSNIIADLELRQYFSHKSGGETAIIPAQHAIP